MTITINVQVDEIGHKSQNFYLQLKHLLDSNVPATLFEFLLHFNFAAIKMSRFHPSYHPDRFENNVILAKCGVGGYCRQIVNHKSTFIRIIIRL